MGMRLSEICIDAADVRTLGGWWADVLGWPQEDTEDGDVLLRAPAGAGPDWLFVPVADDRVCKNRIHFDFTPTDQQAEVDRLVELGARHIDIGQGQQSWIVLADPEGNEFCVLSAE